ncbi:signal peptidase II [Neorhizobium sp. LjRoot104]|uniref:signal peptidase II n=1 Tax=Neorhizobium sp. LjRoot104 TaxID=3342254 RepID=UPI003ECC5743
MTNLSIVTLKKPVLILFWIATLCLLDLAVKYLVVNHLMDPPRVIPITAFFNLTLAYNPGVSFSLFSDAMASAPRLFALLQGGLVLGLVVWAWKAKYALESLAITTIAGGASGNVVDRLLNLSVTDYLDFHLYGWSWPTFNLADIMIVCGALFMIAVSFRQTGNNQSTAT